VILSRKLLAPALIMFALLLAGLFAFFFSDLHEVNHQAEEADLASFSDSFFAEVENQKQLALALASQAAGDPEIQAALAERNRQELLRLISPGFALLQENNKGIFLYQFHLPNGSLFLTNQAGSVQTSTSPTITLATSSQTSVAGLEAENGKLVIRGVAPVIQEGDYVGAVEIGIGLDSALLANLKSEFGGEWQILLSREFFQAAEPEMPSPDPNFAVYATTQSSLLFNETSSYASAMDGTSTITHPSISGRDYAFLTAPLLDESGRIVGVLDIIYDHTHISTAQNTRLLIAGLISLLTLAFGSILLTLLTRRTLQPIQLLTKAAAEIAEGNVTAYVNMEEQDDEIGILIRAFNRMTSQLRGSIVDLEQRVNERTRDLENQTLRLRVAAEIARDALSARDLGTLLEKSTQLILDRFNLHHVGIFLVDKNGEFAALTASPTEAGRIMLADKHMVVVGGSSLVGRAAATGESQVSHDSVLTDTKLSALLPDARSEIAVPLKADQKILGVLDIHSDRPQAFRQNDVAIMQVLADQLAIAIEKTRLAQEVSQTLEELERSYGRYTRESWQNLTASQRLKNKGYRFDNIRIEPADGLAEYAEAALANGNVVHANGQGTAQKVAIPIKLRGQTIGVVQTTLKEGAGDNTIETLQLAIERLASALESARLYEQASLRADREQAISQISNAISSSSEYETIMRTTIRELGNLLDDTEVAIQILAENDNGNLAP
jgi:GAF domain-containing protein/HAMP domain-containing protein